MERIANNLITTCGMTYKHLWAENVRWWLEELETGETWFFMEDYEDFTILEGRFIGWVGNNDILIKIP